MRDRDLELHDSYPSRVEITLMKHGDHHLVHLVNISGHSQTGYFNPVPMANIELKVKGVYHRASAIRQASELPIAQSGDYSTFTVPSLTEYELIELQ